MFQPVLAEHFSYLLSLNHNKKAYIKTNTLQGLIGIYDSLQLHKVKGKVI